MKTGSPTKYCLDTYILDLTVSPIWLTAPSHTQTMVLFRITAFFWVPWVDPNPVICVRVKHKGTTQDARTPRNQT